MLRTLQLLTDALLGVFGSLLFLARRWGTHIVACCCHSCMHTDTLIPLQAVSGMALPLYTLNMLGIHQGDMRDLPPDPSSVGAFPVVAPTHSLSVTFRSHP